MTRPLPDRQESAYWLAFAFHLEGEKVQNKNGLVLTADRRESLGLLDLVMLDPADLPNSVQRYAATHERLLQAEGRVSAQAFVVDQLQEAGVVLLPITHASYPGRLARILTPRKAPTVLLTAGNLELLQEPGVAVSGSRKAGPTGLAFAREMGRALARASIPVITGLARGVDSEAVEGALEAGGSVIGIAPEGILNSRAVNRPEIAEGRLLVVSEFAPTAKWAGWAAMKRNHTIAGLSRALMIADCVSEGGTTAQFKVHRDLGIPVCVRRGRGEGALMGELAARPGGIPLNWEQGPIRLPDGLGGTPARRVESRLSRSNGRLLIHVDAPENVTFSEVTEALRDAWKQNELKPDPGSAAHEAAPPPYSSSSEASPAGDEDPVMSALRGLPHRTGTVAVLSSIVGWSKKKTRSRLQAMEEAGLVSADRTKRAHHFSPTDSYGDAKRPLRSDPPDQLALLPETGGR
jgi:hypothetical protein